MENDERRAKIMLLKDSLRTKNSELATLIDECPHEIEKGNKDLESSSAKCKICGSLFGWYCPDSPDHTCHYYSEEEDDGRRYVRLVDGRKQYLPDSYAKKIEDCGESDDWCIFCGHPEERK